MEVNTASTVGGGISRRRHYTSDFTGGPIVVRIRHLNPWAGSPQGYSLTVRIQEWIPNATAVAAECPVTTWGGLDTNYQLAALPAAAPNLAELRAIGYGWFDVFVVSDQPAAQPLQLPAPYSSVCDVLANVVVAVPGTPVGWPAPQPTEWVLLVPALPPGLVLYAQHLSASLGWPFWFGASNRVRLDT